MALDHDGAALPVMLAQPMRKKRRDKRLLSHDCPLAERMERLTMSDESTVVDDKGEVRDKGGEYGGLAGTMGSSEHRKDIKTGQDEGAHGDGRWRIDDSVQTSAGAHDSVNRVADPTSSNYESVDTRRDEPIPPPDSGRTGDSTAEIEARENPTVRRGMTGTEANDAF